MSASAGLPGLALLALAVGLVDGLNPSTIGPAILLALRADGLKLLGAFAAAVFVVPTAAGIAVALGPGRLLVEHMPHLGSHAKHIAALVAGGVLVGAAVLVWSQRHAASRALGRKTADSPAAAAALGAGIIAVELPTAFPYVAVLAAIAASSATTTAQIGLVLLFNAAFVAPLAVIAVLRVLAGTRAAGSLARVGSAVTTYGPAVLAGVFAVAGSALLVFGAAGAFGARS